MGHRENLPHRFLKLRKFGTVRHFSRFLHSIYLNMVRVLCEKLFSFNQSLYSSGDPSSLWKSICFLRSWNHSSLIASTWNRPVSTNVSKDFRGGRLTGPK